MYVVYSMITNRESCEYCELDGFVFFFFDVTYVDVRYRQWTDTGRLDYGEDEYHYANIQYMHIGRYIISLYKLLFFISRCDSWWCLTLLARLRKYVLFNLQIKERRDEYRYTVLKNRNFGTGNTLVTSSTCRHRSRSVKAYGSTRVVSFESTDCAAEFCNAQPIRMSR